MCRSVDAPLPSPTAASTRKPAAADVPSPKRTRLWRLYGAVYDLEAFVKSHPGGEVAIRLAQGTDDASDLFASYHPVGHGRAWSVLESFRVGGEPPKPAPPSQFALDLRAMVREHFGTTSRAPHKATAGHAAVCFVFAAVQIACWVGWMRGSYAAMLGATFFHWLTAVNISHDASHFAFSASPAVNELLVYASLPLMFAPLTWYHQHVVAHHTGCNDVSRDVDLQHFAPMKLHPSDSRTNPHGGHTLLDYAKVLVSSVHLVLGVPLFNSGLLPFDWYTAHYAPAVLLLPGLKASPLRRALNLLPPVLFAAFAAYPMLAFDALHKRALFVLVPIVGSSLVFLLFTQVSHIQPEAQLAETQLEPDFFKRQARTAVDYSTGSTFWGYMSGGLNLQSLHHCLPYVNSCHFGALYPKFEAVCARHGVVLVKRRGIWDAACTAMRHVWTLNGAQRQRTPAALRSLARDAAPTGARSARCATHLRPRRLSPPFASACRLSAQAHAERSCLWVGGGCANLLFDQLRSRREHAVTQLCPAPWSSSGAGVHAGTPVAAHAGLRALLAASRGWHA